MTCVCECVCICVCVLRVQHLAHMNDVCVGNPTWKAASNLPTMERHRRRAETPPTLFLPFSSSASPEILLHTHILTHIPDSPHSITPLPPPGCLPSALWVVQRKRLQRANEGGDRRQGLITGLIITHTHTHVHTRAPSYLCSLSSFLSHSLLFYCFPSLLFFPNSNIRMR